MENTTIPQKEATPHLAAVRSNPPRNMNLREAAAYLGISARKLRYMIAEGRIRSVRFGRRIVLRLQDLDEVLQHHLQ